MSRYRTAWEVSFLLKRPVIDSSPDSASNICYQYEARKIEILLYCPIDRLERILLFEEWLLALGRRYLAPEDLAGSTLAMPANQRIQSCELRVQTVVD